MIPISILYSNEWLLSLTAQAKIAIQFDDFKFVNEMKKSINKFTFHDADISRRNYRCTRKIINKHTQQIYKRDLMFFTPADTPGGASESEKEYINYNEK